MSVHREMRDTSIGLLRRTGPASAEVFDTETGTVYAINFAVFASEFFVSDENGRELADQVFSGRAEPRRAPGQ